MYTYTQRHIAYSAFYVADMPENENMKLYSNDITLTDI